MQRRHFVSLALGSLLLPAHAQPAPGRTIDAMRAEWRSFLPPGATVPEPTTPLKLSRDEWKKKLAPAAFDVLREEGTERAGSSALNGEKRRGVYACAGCGLPLFTSEMKYESGTGWPSFFTTIPGVFGMKKDHKIFHVRDEYHCVRCGGHHGHVFDDGPPPTRQRWCNNGVALAFLPADFRSK
jgi:peptide-methionine (R)-S-oxide reductase